MRVLTSSLSIGVCLSAFSGAAFAQSECVDDADCAEGTVCEVVGSSGCAAPACPDGEPDCVTEPVDCETQEFSACVPAPCESDADCGEDMVCHTYEWETCDGGSSVSCDSEGNCEDMEVVSNCESGSTSECIYRWQEPCTEDADCGSNFTCVTDEVVCDCGGGVAMDPASGAESGGGMDPVEGEMAPPADVPVSDVDGGAGTAPLPPETTDCDCGGQYSYCQADEIPCETADECPSGWSCLAPPTGCEDVPVDETTERPAPMAADAGAPDENLVPPDEQGGCEPVAAPSQCVPPGGGFDIPGRPTTGSDGSTDDPDTEEGEGGVDLPEPPVEEPADDGDNDAGAAGGGEDEGDDGEPEDDDIAQGGEGDPEDDEPAADAGAEDEEEEDDQELEGAGGDSDSGDDGGCSVAEAPTRGGSAAWLAALLGLSLLRRRR